MSNLDMERISQSLVSTDKDDGVEEHNSVK